METKYKGFIKNVKVSVIIPVYNQEKLIVRAIDSIPKREDVEIIVIDDGSTDNTVKNIQDKDIKLFTKKHTGVADTVNIGYDIAQGEYVVLLGSDDFFYTKEFEKCLKELDGTDLVYFDCQLNQDFWNINEDTRRWLCGSVKFIRREFLGNTRAASKPSGEDRPFNEELLEKNPTEKFTHLVVKHYNHPREGSLTDLVHKGIIDDGYNHQYE